MDESKLKDQIEGWEKGGGFIEKSMLLERETVKTYNKEYYKTFIEENPSHDYWPNRKVYQAQWSDSILFKY